MDGHLSTWCNRTTVEQRYTCPWGCEICQDSLTMKLKRVFNYVYEFLVVLRVAFEQLTDDFFLCRLANQRTARSTAG
jgi:hypothetical protein